MISWKQRVGMAAAMAMIIPLVACGSTSESSSLTGTENVELTVWTPAEDQAQNKGNWLDAMEQGFAKEHPEYRITWKNDVVSEGDVATKVEADPHAVADVYMFANDQLGTLLDNEAIGKLPESSEQQVEQQNSATLVDSVTGQNGELYGVPYTDNTWFMYYNKSMLSADEIASFNVMLDNTSVAFPLTDPWYTTAFYAGAGTTFFGEDGTQLDDGITFSSNTPDVTKYLVDLVNNDHFVDDDGTSGIQELKNGSVAVYFSDSWNAPEVKEALGDNYAAAALPTFTMNNKTYQMKAFAGSKAIGYNPSASNPKAAALFAAYLGSTKAQKKHWDLRHIIPTDKTLTNLEGMSSDPAVAAQMETIEKTSITQPTFASMSVWWDQCRSMSMDIDQRVVTEANAEEKTRTWEQEVAQEVKTYHDDSDEA